VENLKKRLAENSLNNHFLPLAKSSSRALLLLPLTRVILRVRRRRSRMKVRKKNG